MARNHPNISLLNQLDRYLEKSNDLSGAEELFATDFIWHFFNPKLPDLQGDYRGVDGLKIFFEKLGLATEGTFQVKPITAMPIGDELVVTHVQDSLEWQGQAITLDAVVVWRIVGERIAEAWDIPSLYAVCTPSPDAKIAA